jgi:hypothetical protein
MVKIIIAVGIFLIICFAAVAAEIYEDGYGNGYAEAMRNAEEIYRKEKEDGEKSEKEPA